MTAHEMVRWHPMDMSLNGLQEIGQRSLLCCSPRGRKESDTTEQLNDNNILNSMFSLIILFISETPLFL